MYGCMDVWMYGCLDGCASNALGALVRGILRAPAHPSSPPACQHCVDRPRAQEQAAESGGGPIDGRPDMEWTVGYGVSVWVWVSLSLCVCASNVCRTPTLRHVWANTYHPSSATEKVDWRCQGRWQRLRQYQVIGLPARCDEPVGRCMCATKS